MFVVFNKDKMYAYGISIITVILLFCVANVMLSYNNDTISTTATTTKLLPVYKVDTKENEVSLTLNCAW